MMAGPVSFGLYSVLLKRYGDLTRSPEFAWNLYSQEITDATSGLQGYEVAIGSTVLVDDIRPWTSY